MQFSVISLHFSKQCHTMVIQAQMFHLLAVYYYAYNTHLCIVITLYRDILCFLFVVVA